MVTTDAAKSVAATFNTYFVYLPMVARNYVVAPDLVVQRITATTNNAQVVIKNQGNAPVVDDFWVNRTSNLTPYRRVSTKPGVMGALPRALYGVWFLLLCRWRRERAHLNLQRGRLPANLGNYGMIPVDTPVYTQVDSANTETTYGAVLETHEINDVAYNNILGPVMSTLSIAGDGPPNTEPRVASSLYTTSDRLPSRP